jgi:NAD(P)-dependent dehydrogenase (short-subunit alcohol dehydrogenase family)
VDLELQRRRAVVTGASRGIGRAIALALGTITVRAADLSQAAAIQGLTAEQETGSVIRIEGGMIRSV